MAVYIGDMVLKTMHSEGFCTRLIFMYLSFGVVVSKDVTKLISVPAVIKL